MNNNFLPTSLEEGRKYYKELTEFDIVFVTGDPYYDHPLSGVAILSRLLDSKGYKVGIISQPVSNQDYLACGRAKYFFCITSGLLDSMLANYTPMLKKRINVMVPERALMVYTQKIKQNFKGASTILGGVEATIRRFTHFDYRSNKLRRGILNDTKADLLIFGNAERPILHLAQRFKQAYPENNFEDIKEKLNLANIDGIAYMIKKSEDDSKSRILPSFEDCIAEKLNLGLLTKTLYEFPESPFVEQCGLGYVQHNAPSCTLSEEEMDFIYEMPFTRKISPNTKNFEINKTMVEKLSHSVVIGRGCWGSCSFCIIPMVQGKEIAKRSAKSILKEIESIYSGGAKKISDLTLPTINMYGSKCANYSVKKTIYSPILEKDITVFEKKLPCNQRCAGCKFRIINDELGIVIDGIEKLNTIHNGTSFELRSAIRHDIILKQKSLFRKIMRHVKRLKIAPEILSDKVLKLMNKSSSAEFNEFLAEYKKINQEQKTNKNLVPYFIAAHPGSTFADMEETKKFCSRNGIYVNLTQVFTPTPGTLSTAIYYTGKDPYSKKDVYVPRTFREKKDQKNILLSDSEDFFDDNG